MPKDKPPKPYKGFPLFAHQSGQWCKKILGKPWYFGVWADPDAALSRYLDEIDEIRAGRDPRKQDSGAATVADVCNHYLGRLNHRRESGEITNAHFSDCKKSCLILVSHFGRRVLAASLKASDFSKLMAAFPDQWGPTTKSTVIQRIRTVFKWAAEAEIIPALPNFGPDFKKSPRRVSRILKADQKREYGRLDYTAEEIRALLAVVKGWPRACILLGINAGFGNAHCGGLRRNNIDLKTGWYDVPRAKSGIDRRFYVWEETRQAIREAMDVAPRPKDPAHRHLCFISREGRPVLVENTIEGITSRTDSVANRFRVAVTICGLQRPGRAFYSLRRTFETVAGGTKDQVAVNYIMGHQDVSMAAVYRQGIDDQRLIDVAEHVRQWLWMRKCDACGEAQFSVEDEWTCESCAKGDAAEE
ncbi:MAG: tyrosine-type recombinase/integrase [Fuerstiella sp.]